MSKVLHVITSLGDGGAEGVLYRLCSNDNNNEHVVISLINEGKYISCLKNNGIAVDTLNFEQGKISLNNFISLYKGIKNHNPDIVQTWMYHSDLFAGLAAKLLGVKHIIWNIRHSSLEPSKTKRSTIIVAKLCAVLSKFIPNRIICCAESAREAHIKYGYQESKMTVIPNGYEVDKFKFTSTVNYENKVNIGMVGRYAPEKDHNNLLSALKIIKDNGYVFSMKLIGKNMTSDNVSLMNDIKNTNVLDCVELLGPRNDIPEVLSKLDIHTLSSSSEGFPNVLAEAMLCGIPCVTTNAGDASFIVGNTGWVVDIEDNNMLAEALMKAMDSLKASPQDWSQRKIACRHKVVSEYSLPTMIKKYNDVWNDS